MRTILVSGGTGTVGRPTVDHLRTAGHHVRVLTRRPGPGPGRDGAAGHADAAGPEYVTGDLGGGERLADAVRGADAVVHLATSRRGADVAQTANLVRALRSAGTPHVVLISIVGVDRIPMGYYRAKVEVERVVVDSGVPYTILRATQFHDLLDEIFTVQRALPLLLAPAVTLQPIAVEDVAARLADLAAGDPAGRVPDIGGPQRRSVVDLARAWTRAKRARRPVVPLRLPGKAFRAYDSDAPLVPGTPYGVGTFDGFLADRYGVAV